MLFQLHKNKRIHPNYPNAQQLKQLLALINHYKKNLDYIHLFGYSKSSFAIVMADCLDQKQRFLRLSYESKFFRDATNKKIVHEFFDSMSSCLTNMQNSQNDNPNAFYDFYLHICQFLKKIKRILYKSSCM